MIPLSRLFGGDSSSDFQFIDDYLKRWDQFAQGANDLGQDRDQFLDELTTGLKSNPKKAMSRAVFFAVVQVGGFIPCDSPLGTAIEKEVGPEVAVYTSKEGQKSYFAGRLYFWWESHKKDYEAFPLFDEYLQRDFAKKTVIPMYTAVVKKSDH